MAARQPWTHDEAKRHTVIERLLERCAAWSPTGTTCADMPESERCERCLAAERLLALGDR